MRTFRGKKALVTGAASGIGRAIALALAREGATLCLVDIDETGLAAVSNEVTGLGAAGTTAICDLSQSDRVEALIHNYKAANDRLDILVNCAGIGSYGRIDDLSDEQWRSILAVNLHSPIQLIRGFLPLMTAQKESHILNVCSIAGLVPVRKSTLYQTTKFGLVGFSFGLQAEFRGCGLGVTILCPGVVETPFVERHVPNKFKRMRYLKGIAWSTAESVAAKAINAIRRNRTLVVTTPLARGSWWLYRVSPWLGALLTRSQR